MEEQEERIRCVNCGKVLFEAKKAEDLLIKCSNCKKKYLITITNSKVKLKEANV